MPALAGADECHVLEHFWGREPIVRRRGEALQPEREGVAVLGQIRRTIGVMLPVTGTDGITRIVRSCVDGPVFRGDVVRWDDMGTIPFDALGAPGWKPLPAQERSAGSAPARISTESRHAG